MGSCYSSKNNINITHNISTKTKTHKIDKELYDYSKENDILIIPLVKEYNLDNLYPKEDEVEKWNIFIVGQDKTYIKAQINEKSFEIKKELINNRADNDKVSPRFQIFLDKIWNNTLRDNQLQFFTYINSKLYLLNSYPFKNHNKKVIGGICFIREAGIINKKVFDLEMEHLDME